jgi:hypothetical protein
MWKIFSVPCGSALYKFHCILLYYVEQHMSSIKFVLLHFKVRNIFYIHRMKHLFFNFKANLEKNMISYIYSRLRNGNRRS